MDEGKKHTVGEFIKNFVDTGGEYESLRPGGDHQLTDFVEWIIVHKGCGKPLIGSSPKNGWCMCSMATGAPPEIKPTEVVAKPSETAALEQRCAKAEKEVATLNEKLDKASKKIAELIKGKKAE